MCRSKKSKPTERISDGAAGVDEGVVGVDEDTTSRSAYWM
jgi:hypothetical protein